MEIWWHQRSRVRWAQLGDQNTKLFDASATERWRRNPIVKLQRDDGIWIENVHQTRVLLMNYYKNLYSEVSGGDTVQQMFQQQNLDLP
jgi:hypothetical protein